MNELLYQFMALALSILLGLATIYSIRLYTSFKSHLLSDASAWIIATLITLAENQRTHCAQNDLHSPTLSKLPSQLISRQTCHRSAASLHSFVQPCHAITPSSSSQFIIKTNLDRSSGYAAARLYYDLRPNFRHPYS